MTVIFYVSTSLIEIPVQEIATSAVVN